VVGGVKVVFTGSVANVAANGEVLLSQKHQ
jgi:hypothetical protein